MDHISSALKHPQFNRLKGGVRLIDDAQQILCQVLPEELRTHIRIIAVHDDHITVGAEHPTWLTQARYHGDVILEALQRHHAFAHIEQLRYRVHYVDVEPDVDPDGDAGGDAGSDSSNNPST